MPDPTLKTISASQIPGLFGESQWTTRFLLWQHFAGNVDLDESSDDRMEWGTRLQAPVMDHLQEQLGLEILNNGSDLYFRHPKFETPGYQIGCTPDGYVWSPDRGLGFVEIKCVDGRIYSESWTPKTAPKHVEIQHQVQLMVPAPVHGHVGRNDKNDYGSATQETWDFLLAHKGEEPQWGMIVAFVGGNSLKIIERKIKPAIQKAVRGEVKSFFASLKNGRVPSVAGLSCELPALNELYPETIDKTLHDEDFGDDVGELLLELQSHEYWGGQARLAKSELEKAKVQLVQRFGEAGRIRISGAVAKLKKIAIEGTTKALPPHVNALIRAAAEREQEPQFKNALKMAADFSVTTRKPSTQNRITVAILADEIPDPFVID